jgi:ubiquinone/menaquinone biosynthesis C-methylase UbiE
VAGRKTSAVTGDQLYTNPDLAQFYDLENGWSDDFTFCANLATQAKSVLDIGCGTGALLAALAPERAVGVDLAAAMLDIARGRKGGAQVAWVQADARRLDLGARFDLIILTSHAFQVFLTDEDQHTALETIRRHLAPNGRFVFDTRNPARKAWKGWTPARTLRCVQHPKLGEVRVWNDALYEAATQIVSYETHYQHAGGGQGYAATSRIRFTSQPELAQRITAAGLTVSNWLGSWQGEPFAADAPEIIVIGQLAT